SDLRPLAFAVKVARQLAVFYSTDCPAFSARKIFQLAPRSYAQSFSALSEPRSLQLLFNIPEGIAFFERTQTLRFSNVVVHQTKLARIGHVCCARSYLAILLISLPLAGWFVLKRRSPGKSEGPITRSYNVFESDFQLTIQHSCSCNGDSLQKANPIIGCCIVPDWFAHQCERAV